MRVPLSWLKEFLALDVEPTDRPGVVALGEVLDSLGLVIEEIDYLGTGLEGVVLAHVEDIRAIEGADKIRHISVEAGTEHGKLEIVCGAWNFEVGDVVPLAPVGVTLPNGMTIARRKMRGVESNGMLCSAAELGLGEDQGGLLVLGKLSEERLGAGRALTEALGIVPDVVFDVAVEPNRPDCLSIIGVARDLGARLGLPFSIPEPIVLESNVQVASIGFVKSEEPESCPQLIGRVLQGVTDFPSLGRVVDRLEKCGMRSISAVVDASNYAMLELGQPNHPYDLARLSGPGISVRFAHEGEHLGTLDGEEHELEGEDLVIVDGADVPVGLAGVMGGAASEIDPGTDGLFLEVAQFEPIVIGRAAARHGLRTEAMARFWRGIDPLGLERCANRVIELIQEAAREAGAPVPLAAVGVLADRPRPYQPVTVALRPARLNALLGTELSAEQMIGHLTPIGFRAGPMGEVISIDVPSWRPDARREVDVIEEVARHHGYEQITPRTPRSPFVGQLSDLQRERRVLRRVLQGVGADEAWTSSIVDPRLEALAGQRAETIVVSNPIVASESVLRTHLLAGLLGSLRHNENQQNPNVALFEVGAVFIASSAEGGAPAETEHLGAIFARDNQAARDAMSAWHALCSALRLDESMIDLVQHDALVRAPEFAAGLHPTRAAAIVSRQGGSEVVVGAIGEVDPSVLSNLSLSARRVGALFVDVQRLLSCARRDELARTISKYPPSEIDLAFSLAESVDAIALERAIVHSAGELAETVRLIDVYRGENLPEGTRSLAYRLRFRALDRTLTEAEIAEARSRVIDAVQSTLPARLR